MMHTMNKNKSIRKQFKDIVGLSHNSLNIEMLSLTRYYFQVITAKSLIFPPQNSIVGKTVSTCVFLRTMLSNVYI